MSEVSNFFVEMYQTKSLVVIIAIFSLLLGGLLMIMWQVFNSIYTKRYRDDLIELFLGKENGKVFTEVGGELGVLTHLFLNMYFFDVIFRTNKGFPSIHDPSSQPFYMTPNAYKENIDFFKTKRKYWLCINIIVMAVYYSFIAIFFILCGYAYYTGIF